ncbi:hypothetical protein VCHENC02_1217A, partial [Vibrio harveyi]
MCLWYKLTSF